jgi:glutamate-ammonia-ligase adenylyltransferase
LKTQFPKFCVDTNKIPNPAHLSRAETSLELWCTYAAEPQELRTFCDAIAHENKGQILRAVFGNSTFLTQCLIKDRSFMKTIMEQGPDHAYGVVVEALENELGQVENLATMMTGLRKAKQRIALVVGLSDIVGLWSVDQVTEKLSYFADQATNLAVRFALRQSAATGCISLKRGDTPEDKCGYALIAVGKLGAKELNYSSDIDLVAIYDPERVGISDRDKLGAEMARMTRLIVKLIEERSPDGYVFRVDFRIRPDPGSTPLAIPIESALRYYENTGQNWERLAFIRARPMAGDMTVGQNFLDSIQPFIWRKNLDFAAIQDIHSVKRQIAAHRGGSKIAINGHNIKLGRGGIREIEFFAQTQQLIWGGRSPNLRTRKLSTTLKALATEGRISTNTAKELNKAYKFLRKLEHRLQMVDDRQIHSLPKTDEEVAAIGKFLGYDRPEGFRRAVLGTLEKVESYYAALFEESENLGTIGNLVFTGVEDDPDTLESLSTMGFANPQSISEVVRNWHRGRYRSTRTERARQILTELMPSLLSTFGGRTYPDRALMHFDAFLAALPSGIQLFSLFANHPLILKLVAEIMGDAPVLADWLSKNPSLLDHVLSPEFGEPLGTMNQQTEELRQQIEHAQDFQDQLDACRRWANDKKFQIGVQLMLGRLRGRHSGPLLSDVAEIVLREMLKCVSVEFEKTHGAFETSGLAIIALGKLGSRELMRGSDLDLVFVYDDSTEQQISDGEKPLGLNIYFMRLAQRMITALTALTGEGRLYQTDTRLRPNGEEGPIASSFVSFKHYYQESAWTWEYMALSRARVVAGPDNLKIRLQTTICEAITRGWDDRTLISDVAQMRRRMAKQYPGTDPWDIKHRRGGLVDGEFIAQYLQLHHGSKHPEILSPNASNALEKLSKAGLLEAKTVKSLGESLRFWHDVQSVLRVTTDQGLDNSSQSSGPREALVRAGFVESYEQLLAKMDANAEIIYTQFNALFSTSSEKTETTS